LTIKDALADGKEIFIRAFPLPIINRKLLDTELVPNTDLKELFKTRFNK
jgi:5-methylcytosine-specific restriction enzyme subunit McrC